MVKKGEVKRLNFARLRKVYETFIVGLNDDVYENSTGYLNSAGFQVRNRITRNIHEILGLVRTISQNSIFTWVTLWFENRIAGASRALHSLLHIRKIYTGFVNSERSRRTGVAMTIISRRLRCEFVSVFSVQPSIAKINVAFKQSKLAEWRWFK